MVMSATYLSDVSLMAMVPDSECRMPILIGPLSSAGAGAAGAAGAAPGAGAGASLLQAERAASERTAINDPVNVLRMCVSPSHVFERRKNLVGCSAIDMAKIRR